VSRVPRPVRRLLWWSTLNVSGFKRAKRFGTFGLTSYGSLGAESLHPISPLTTTLTYGPIDPATGQVVVKLIYDHRVLDGAYIARRLRDIEDTLHGPILDELRRDPALQRWIRERPALVRLGDGTLVQHCGHDGYLEMADEDSTNVIETVNRRVKEMLQHGQEDVLWTAMSGKNIFGSQPERLRRWLEATQSRRVVFGHTPHNSHAPERYHDGAAINFDGAFSRQHLRRRKQSPIGASVAPLDSVK